MIQPNLHQFQAIKLSHISIYKVNLIFHIHAIRGAVQFNENLTNRKLINVDL